MSFLSSFLCAELFLVIKARLNPAKRIFAVPLVVSELELLWADVSLLNV